MHKEFLLLKGETLPDVNPTKYRPFISAWRRLSWRADFAGPYLSRDRE